ncbi:MAG: hypothetical protein GX113_06430 [Actinobacteria bacterium]|jgi:receptor protein-tyrosine kinase|nr:hypothetical protein [Actinomycetota bacterium]
MNDDSGRDHSTYIDLSQILRILWERKWIIIGLAIVALVGSLWLSMTRTPQYRATSEVMLENTRLSEALFGAQIFTIRDQQRALATATNLLKTNSVADMVKKDLGVSQSSSSLLGMITVAPSSTADMISITAVSSDPFKAAQVANSFARQFVLFRQETDRATLRAAQAQVQAQLDAMTPAEQASARGLTLSQKVEELAVLESLQTGGFEVTQEAVVPTASFAPRTYRDAGIALVLGIILGLVVALLLQILDRRIKDEEVAQKEFGAPVIATIPMTHTRWAGIRESRWAAPVGFDDSGSPTLEAFRTLRSNLKYFQIDRKLKILLVTSSLPREGKTTTSVNLSIALAMSGSRVILLEADLRRPMVREYLQLADGPGLSNLLSGTAEVAQVARVVNLEKFLPHDHMSEVAFSGESAVAQSGFLCVTSGPLPPNPAELLATRRTSEVLGLLTPLCDYLVIDAPPLLLVSDALELAKHADGVVLVAKLRSTKIEEARRTRDALQKVGITPIGVTVLGAEGTKAYYRRYGGYYAKT